MSILFIIGIIALIGTILLILANVLSVVVAISPWVLLAVITIAIIKSKNRQ